MSGEVPLDRPANLRHGATALGIRQRRIAIALVVVLICYGSLYPFDLQWGRFLSLWRDGAFLVWRSSGRGDALANLLFYTPLGALLAWRPAASGARLREVAFAASVGLGLSLVFELAQLASPTRTSSMLDVLLNTLSAAIGAASIRIAAWRPSLQWRLPWRDGSPARPALLALGLWFVWHCAPFIPQISRSAWIDALRPALELRFEAGGLAKYVAAYVLLGMILRTLLRRAAFWPAFWAAAAASGLARVVFVDQSVSINEVAGGAIALAFLVAVHRRSQAAALWSAVTIVLGGWVVHGIDPFDFQATPQRFGWVPFRSLIERDFEGALLSIAEQGFMFVGTIWIISCARLSIRTATMLVATTVGAVEVLQSFLPSRVPEITDPMLALLAGVVVHLLAVRRPSDSSDEKAPLKARRTIAPLPAPRTKSRPRS